MSIPLLPARDTKLAGFFRHDYVIAALIAVAASGLTFALGFALGWFPNGVNGFEVVAATLNYAATYLSIKQRRFTYALGFVASAFWAIAFYQYGLIASAILSLYLVAQLVYGYFRWGPDGKGRPVHKFQWKWLPVYALATAVTYGGAVAISTAFGGSFAFWDGAILVATIWAQFMLDNKVLGTWYVWMLVNIIGVTLYATAGAPFAVVQQFLFGLANIWGYLSWRKSMRNSEENFSKEAISKIQPKEENGLMFTDGDTDEWRRVTPDDLVTYAAADAEATLALHDRFVADNGGDPNLPHLTKGQYSGSSKVAATYHDPDPTTEIDQVAK